MMMVLPSSRFRRSIMLSTSAAAARSRSPVGSSATSIVGSVMIARAMATRCCWPPDSSDGKCSMRSVSPTIDKRGGHVLLALAGRQIGQQQRQFDVFERGQHRHQVVELEDEADVARAPRGEIGLAQRGDVDAADAQTAAVGLVDAGNQVEQRALARTGRPHQRDVIAGGDIERDIRSAPARPGRRGDTDLTRFLISTTGCVV